jgi:hypothetical protein
MPNVRLPSEIDKSEAKKMKKELEDMRAKYEALGLDLSRSRRVEKDGQKGRDQGNKG